LFARGALTKSGVGFEVQHVSAGADGGFIRYVEGDRDLSLAYNIVNETEQRGRRLFVLRRFVWQIQIPTALEWNDGTPMSAVEAAVAIDRMRRWLEIYGREVRVVVDDTIYGQLAAADRAVAQRGWGKAPGKH